MLSFSYTPGFGMNFAVEINGKSVKNNFCRVWVNTLDRKDGTFIVRYKVYETCMDLKVSIYYKSKHINESPLTLEGIIIERYIFNHYITFIFFIKINLFQVLF